MFNWSAGPVVVFHFPLSILWIFSGFVLLWFSVYYMFTDSRLTLHRLALLLCCDSILKLRGSNASFYVSLVMNFLIILELP